ncbi:MAG: hypothetical protein K2K31_01605 [Clostridia bacterium]|nr:hypothetical protein [Clostridia bacterium]
MKKGFTDISIGNGRTLNLNDLANTELINDIMEIKGKQAKQKPEPQPVVNQNGDPQPEPTADPQPEPQPKARIVVPKGVKNVAGKQDIIKAFAERMVETKLDEKKDVNAFEQDITASYKNDTRWATAKFYTPEQKQVVLDLNTQLINWAVEERTKDILLGQEKHDAIVQVLAEEMSKAKFEGSVEDLIAQIDGAYLDDKKLSVKGELAPEQQNVIDVVNSYYPSLQLADKREAGIVSLAEKANKVLNSELEVNAWKEAIRGYIKNGERLSIDSSIEYSDEQVKVILDTNRKLIEWTIEDETQNLKGKEKHDAIVNILANELVKTGDIEGSVKDWISLIENCYTSKTKFEIAGTIKPEQQNVVNVANAYLKTLRKQEDKEVGAGVAKNTKAVLKNAAVKTGNFFKKHWWKVLLVVAGVAVVGTSVATAVGTNKDDQGIGDITINVTNPDPSKDPEDKNPTKDPDDKEPNKEPDGSSNANTKIEIDKESLTETLNEQFGKNFTNVIASTDGETISVYGVTNEELYKVTAKDAGEDGKLTQEDIDALRTAKPVVAKGASTVLSQDYSDSFENFDNTYFSVGKPDASGKVDVEKYVVADEYVVEETSSCVVSPTKYASDKNAESKIITVAYDVADYNGYKSYNKGIEPTVVTNTVGSGVKEVDGPELG